MNLDAALPERRFDLMVLNWLLHADFTGDPVAFARQQRLLAEARLRYATGANSEQEEKEEIYAPRR